MSSPRRPFAALKRLTDIGCVGVLFRQQAVERQDRNIRVKLSVQGKGEDENGKSE